MERCRKTAFRVKLSSDSKHCLLGRTGGEKLGKRNPSQYESQQQRQAMRISIRVAARERARATD
eukprot:scaffold324447_cov61-Tisochrysis_lutea.AAC.2